MFENIPTELKELKNWCVWKFVERDGRLTKVPVQAPKGELAKSNDPNTWSSFSMAVDTYKHTDADGIGFFFQPPYVGIDIDDIDLDAERYKAGDFDSNIIYEFYEILKTYAEFSPSGNGVHLIFKGEIPGEARRKNNFEIYTEGRFFTMTGDSLKKYEIINEPTEQNVDYLYNKYIGESKPKIFRANFRGHGIEHDLTDAEVVSQALDSKQGRLFRKLLEGKWEQDYVSQSEADIAFANMLAFWCARDFIQMDRIFRQSGLMREKWDEKRGKTTYGASTLNRAINDTGNVFNPSQRKETPKYNFNFAEDKEKKYPTRSTDDTGNALRVLDRYGDIVRYSYNRKKFYVYNGICWEIDERGLVRKLIDLTIEDMKNEEVYVADGVDEEDAIKAFRNHIKGSRSNTAKKRLEDEIKHHIPVVFEEFNRDDMLLNTLNGYIDLSSGEEYPHDKEKMFSYVANTELTHSQQPDIWTDFLNDIFNYDQEIIDFIQKAVGYSLTGSTREQVMFILHGKGRNGKSIFMETISDMVGDYADNIQAKSLMVRKGDTVNNDIAKLQGKRLVTSSEPDEGFRFDEGLIKQLTGGDTVTARFLYGEEFNYNPKFKIWVTTNHKPLVRGTDDGIWRRLLLIPFEVQIPEEKVDKDLKYKLQREMPAILNWAIEGALKWQREGLSIPDKITNASKYYRKEMDVIQQFIESECEIGIGYEVMGKDLYNSYKKWAQEMGEYKMTHTQFGMKMKDKFKSKRTKHGVKYLGVQEKQPYTGLDNFMQKH